MAFRKPLVLVTGDLVELPVGDSIDGGLTNYTPVVSSSGVTITYTIAKASHKRLIGKTTFLMLDITINTVGVGTPGAVTIDLPFQAFNGSDQTLPGTESAVVGGSMRVHIPSNSTTLTIRKGTDNSVIIGAGYRFIVTGIYESV